MMRYITVILLAILGLTIVQAQEIDIEVVELEISEGQRVRIVPLFQNFDFFVQLATGEITAGDLPREERYMISCAYSWFGAIDAFELQALDERVGLHESFRESYRNRSETIDDEVIAVIEDALIASAELLASDNLTVCIAPVNEPERYIAGTAHDGTMILLLNEFDADDTETGDMLSVLVAHEYHHHARDADPLTRTSGVILLERIVTEGMAEMFSSLVYPERYATYELLEYQQQEIEIWNIFEPVLRDFEVDHQEYMFGRHDELPPAAGYYLGYRIMQSFIENNPDIPVDEWTRMSGDQIFDASGFAAPSE